MKMKTIFVFGLVPLISICIIVILDDVSWLPNPDELEGELTRPQSSEIWVKQSEDITFTSCMQRDKQLAVPDCQEILEAELWKGPVESGSNTREPSTNIVKQNPRQEQRDSIETLFETLVSNPNNRVEENVYGFTLVVDVDNNGHYYFVRDTDDPAYPAVYYRKFVLVNGREIFEGSSGASCGGLSSAICEEWYRSTLRFFMGLKAQERESDWIIQNLPTNMVENWSSSLKNPLDPYTKNAIIEIMVEENSSLGLMAVSDEGQKAMWTGTVGKAGIDAIRASDERALDRIESFLTEEQYRSYVDFLSSKRIEDERYFHSKEKGD